MFNNKVIIIINCLFILTINVAECQQRQGKNYEQECENEEDLVELCARDFPIFRNDSMPQTEDEMNSFCSTYKEKERCLRDHSNKCLSHSANQAIMELIRTISNKNQAICSNKARRDLYMRANQCFNRQRSQQSLHCYGSFVDRIHGIHQFSQVDKIPIICCNYHEFLSCLRDQSKYCSKDLSNTLLRMVQNYAGETLNYVCKEYQNNSTKCNQLSKHIATDQTTITEAKPKTFFSLLVKIYLS